MIVYALFYSSWADLVCPLPAVPNGHDPAVRATTFDFQGAYVTREAAQLAVSRWLTERIWRVGDETRWYVRWQHLETERADYFLLDEYRLVRDQASVRPHGILRLSRVELDRPWGQQTAFDQVLFDWQVQHGWSSRYQDGMETTNSRSLAMSDSIGITQQARSVGADR